MILGIVRRCRLITKLITKKRFTLEVVFSSTKARLNCDSSLQYEFRSTFTFPRVLFVLESFTLSE